MSQEQEQRHYRKKEPEVTASDLTEKVNHHLATLIEAIKTGNTERMISYLAFSSRFHHYSRRNQQLIFDQKPEATRVASYGKWKKEGYQVAEGEKGIRILVPKHPKFVAIHIQLLGNMHDDLTWDILFSLGKLPFILKTFEECPKT